MAKISSIQKNKRREKMAENQRQSRDSLKLIIGNKSLPLDERIRATLKLAMKSRNASKTRVRNRCELSGRPHGFYRKFKISRIALRELGNQGMIPGLTKSSW